MKKKGSLGQNVRKGENCSTSHFAGNQRHDHRKRFYRAGPRYDPLLSLLLTKKKIPTTQSGGGTRTWGLGGPPPSRVPPLTPQVGRRNARERAPPGTSIAVGNYIIACGDYALRKLSLGKSI